MQLQVSKGVLAKDGTPYAPRTIHAVNKEGWNSPYPYTMASLCILLVNEDITEISIIDEQNQEMTLVK